MTLAMSAKKIVSFFATREDLIQLFDHITPDLEIRCVELGLFQSDAIPTYNSVASALEVSRIFNLSDTMHMGFLVIPRHSSVEVEAVQQRSGGTLYAVDQLGNPMSLVLHPGGRTRNNCLLGGQLGTISRDPWSLSLYQALIKRMSLTFRKLRGVYVTDQALTLLDLGWRLTGNPQSPVLYDLRR